MAWSKLVDMEYDDDDKMDFTAPMPVERPDYPYGLRICLTHKELRKLGLDKPEHGDYLDMRAFGVVTSISGEGDECRVEIQIEKIAVEDEEDE